MSPMSMDEEDDALTEKEWREMRRRMTSLQFDPVPETPELLPRSLYGDHEVQTSKDESPLRLDNAEASTTESSPSLELRMLTSSAVSSEAADPVDVKPLWSSDAPPTPSSSISEHAVLPLTAASLKSAKRRTATSPLKKSRRSTAIVDATNTRDSVSTVSPPVDLADLDATITNAQEQLRLTVLTAVRDATARQERDATLERRKLEAAYTNRLAVLQHQFDELQTKTQTQTEQNRTATQTLDRITIVMVKWKQRECMRRWLTVCFDAWKQEWQDTKQIKMRNHFAAQWHKHHSQHVLLHQWKLHSQHQDYERQLQTQRDEHTKAMEIRTHEYDIKLEKLQNELEAAQTKATVAQQGRQQLEGDLRQVFLRGVSAMNIEALTLFKTTHHHHQQRLEENGSQVEVPSSQDENKDADTIGGESSGELPSEEWMVPINQPTEKVHDPRVHFQSPVPSTTLMPSSLLANHLLKQAGSAKVVLSSETSLAEETTAPPPPPTATMHGLRSAELVEAHQRLLHATATRQGPPTAVQSDPPNGKSLSPAKQRQKVQSSMHFNVEMELVRSSVAAAAALNSRYPIPSISTTTRRAGSIHSGSLASSSSSLTRRASSFMTPTSSKGRQTKS